MSTQRPTPGAGQTASTADRAVRHSPTSKPINAGTPKAHARTALEHRLMISTLDPVPAERRPPNLDTLLVVLCVLLIVVALLWR